MGIIVQMQSVISGHLVYVSESRILPVRVRDQFSGCLLRISGNYYYIRCTQVLKRPRRSSCGAAAAEDQAFPILNIALDHVSECSHFGVESSVGKFYLPGTVCHT